MEVGGGRGVLWTRTGKEQRKEKFICQGHEIKGGFPLVSVIAVMMVFAH